MVELLSPLSLLALASLAVPIVIHLLSQREPRIIKVGTIKFLKTRETPTFRRVAFSEWWLLLLRALLLAIAALALSKPILRARLDAAPPQGWALVSPEVWQRTTDARLYSIADSLRAAGYELRLLAKDFPPLLPDSVALEHVDAWSLLEELDHALPKETRLALLTGERLAMLQGKRPTLSRDIVWHAFASDGKIERMLLARQVGQDSVLTLSGESERERTRFHLKLIHLLDAERQRLVVAPPTPPKRIAILFDDATRRDADYLRYALRAAQEKFFLNSELALLPSQNAAALTTPPDMLFWLSEREVPKRLETTRFILRYASGAPIDAESVIALPDGERVWLKRRIAAPLRDGAIWNDGFGNPILTERRTTRKSDSLSTEYVFYSRFSPEWNALALSPIFPEWIASLLLAELRSADMPELRAATALQRQPKRDSARATLEREQASLTATYASLREPLWIFAAILFIIERIVSHRRARAAEKS